uniref:ADF-H domain-containing protein n=1 Tax=Ditylenchus dipsaci TaxID=166011 RepID=A0A915CQJ0_9BILA
MGNDPLPPFIKQINSFKYRQKKEGTILSIEQLKTYAEANSRIPEEDDDKSFVCAFASSIIDQKQVFCLTWTTQKLRRMQHLSKVIQVDATYKLNWHGFPVMVCGFSDAEQHFFATHLALHDGLMYDELQNNSFVDWKRYELILHSIRIVRPSTIWPSYDVCNCKEGMKKKLCKHSVGATGDDYEDNSKAAYEHFLKDLKERTDGFQDCRYAVFDFKFSCHRPGAGTSKMTRSSLFRYSMFIIELCPDGASIKKKMVYASSASAIKASLGTAKIIQVQVSDESEIAHKELLNKLTEKYRDN